MRNLEDNADGVDIDMNVDANVEVEMDSDGDNEIGSDNFEDYMQFGKDGFDAFEPFESEGLFFNDNVGGNLNETENLSGHVNGTEKVSSHVNENENVNGNVGIEPANGNVNEVVHDNDGSGDEMQQFDEPPADLDIELGSLHGSDSDVSEPDQEYRDEAENEGLRLGMRFASAVLFRKALRAWSIDVGCNFQFKKNCRTVVSVKCKVDYCKFKVRASKVRDSTTFRIKSFNPDHTCPRHYDNHMVSYRFLAEKYLEDFRDDSECKIKILQKKIKRELGFQVSLSMCYRARAAALKIIEGEIKDQYKRLYDYAETIRVTNPVSMVKMKTSLNLVQDATIRGSKDATNIQPIPRELVIFQYMYVRFAAQKQGYFSGLRPIVCLDGCHLKSSMGGQLLSAIARDGNDNMFPLDVAVVDSECKESWTWFLQLLQDDFGTVDETGWVFMSDQQKGLVESFKELMPNVEHRFCVKHMYENMKIRFKGLEYKQHLWGAASAGTVRLWEYHMQKLKEFDESAYDWVMQHDPHSWARCHFSTRAKCDALQNNICESFNSLIAPARSYYIVSLLEWIRKDLMEKNYVKYRGMQRYRGDLCPNVQTFLEKVKVMSRNCFPAPCGEKQYEVTCLQKTVAVDLNCMTCTCRLWDISGIPCKHAIAAIYMNNELPENYVNKYFHKTTYLEVYKHTFKPVPSKEEWERTGFPDIHPWIVRKPPGRPKKRRIRRSDEPRDPYRFSRAGGSVTCGKCQRQGHNAAGCTANITGESPWQRRMRTSASERQGVQLSPKRRGGRPRTSGIGRSNNEGGNSSAPRRTSTPRGRGRGGRGNNERGNSSKPRGGRGGRGNTEGGRTKRANTSSSTEGGTTVSGRSQGSTSYAQLNFTASQPTMNHAAIPNAVRLVQSQPQGMKSRGRITQNVPSTGAPLQFRPPRPHYAATTVSATQKRVTPTNDSGEETSRFVHPRRTSVLVDTAERFGFVDANWDK